MDPVTAKACSFILAGVFAGAAAHKWRHAAAFRQILADYRIVPAVFVPVLAVLLPFLESATAIGLAATAPQAALPAAALLLVYSVAIGINLLRGRRALDCGCGGARQWLSGWLLARNALLLLLAAAAGADRIARPLGYADWGVTLLAAAAGGLSYLILNQLLANRDALETRVPGHA